MKANPFDQPTLIGSGARYQEGMKILGGRFVLERQLGRGGMGEVWLARDAELGDRRALKFLPNEVAHDPKALSQLRREAAAGQRLSHPRIVKTHDLHVTDGHAAVAMEYVEGKTLNGLLAVAEKGYLEVAEIEGWIKDVCEALDYAHGEAKVVHRDLKPANIIIERSTNRAKVLDFGIARRIAETHTQITGKDSSGTVTYSSPQQMNGEKGLPSDDIYALGATIYEVLTGSPPFFRGDLRQQILEKVPPSMTERRAELVEEGMVLGGGAPIPAAWEQLVAVCLAKDPRGRPRDAAEVTTWLSASGGASRRCRVAASVRDSKPRAHKRSLLGTLLTVGFTVVAGGALAVGALHLAKKPSGRPSVQNPQPPVPEVVVPKPVKQPVAPPQPLTGNVYVQSQPQGAHVYDAADKDLGPTPVTLKDLEIGRNHPFKLVLANYEDQKVSVSVASQGIQQWPVVKLERKRGTLTIESTPPKASVLQNKDFLGVTPLELSKEVGVEVVLTLKMDGYRDKEVRCTAKDKEPQTVNGTLEKLSTTPVKAAKGDPFKSSLGLEFLPVPGSRVLLATTETRVADFKKFVEDTGYRGAEKTIISLRKGKFAEHGDTWRNPGFQQTDEHPVCGVNAADDDAFCDWLTKRDRDAGLLEPGQRYRLPESAEWTAAAGPDAYPWGDEFPPRAGQVNLCGEEARDQDLTSDDWPVIKGYNDGYPRTCPVKNCAANALGFYGMGGNVKELCRKGKGAVERGGSWFSDSESKKYLGNTSARDTDPTQRGSIRGFRVALDPGS